MGEEGMKTTLGKKNPHNDNSVASPTLDKDTVIIDHEGIEVVDQPEREPAHMLTIIISRST